MKPTKRLGFHFMRSYFDVLNKLENDADKLSFLLAIINKQFTDENPKDLNFLVELCYESQRHSIEKSVKGWKTAQKTDLQGNPIPPLGGSPIPPHTPPPKEEQVQEEEEEEEEVKEKEKQRTKDFDLFWEKYPIKVAKANAKAKFLKLPQKDIDKIMQTIDSFVNYKPFEKYNHPNPTTYLNQKRWNDEIQGETKKGIDNPNGEKIITFVTNVNPMKQQMTESNFIKYKANMEGGGYKFKIINNGD